MCFQITKVHEYLIFAVFFPFNAECNACPEKILLFRMILTLQVTRRKYVQVTDILDVINGLENEFDELSSSDEDEDVRLDSHLPNDGVIAADNDVSGDSDGDVDDDYAHSSTADRTPARGQQKLRPQVKKTFTNLISTDHSFRLQTLTTFTLNLNQNQLKGLLLMNISKGL